MTPVEKKASELAEQHINDPSRTGQKYNENDLKRISDFKAGFRAAIELEEVKGMEKALDTYKDDSDIEICEACCDCVSDIYLVETTVPKLEPETFGTRAKEALAAWRSFRGEK